MSNILLVCPEKYFSNGKEILLFLERQKKHRTKRNACSLAIKLKQQFLFRERRKINIFLAQSFFKN